MEQDFKYSNHDVAVIYNEDEAQAVLEGLKCIQAEQDIHTDDVVVITPNWVDNQKPNSSEAVVVGPETLRTIIRWVKARNPRRIVVATGSANGNTELVMKDVGYDVVLQQEQVEFIDFNQGPYVELKLNHPKPATIKVNNLINEMTYYISFTQLKNMKKQRCLQALKM